MTEDVPYRATVPAPYCLEQQESNKLLRAQFNTARLESIREKYEVWLISSPVGEALRLGHAYHDLKSRIVFRAFPAGSIPPGSQHEAVLTYGGVVDHHNRPSDPSDENYRAIGAARCREEHCDHMREVKNPQVQSTVSAGFKDRRRYRVEFFGRYHVGNTATLKPIPDLRGYCQK